MLKLFWGLELTDLKYGLKLLVTRYSLTPSKETYPKELIKIGLLTSVAFPVELPDRLLTVVPPRVKVADLAKS